jgi:hypothetical protein
VKFGCLCVVGCCLVGVDNENLLGQSKSLEHFLEHIGHCDTCMGLERSISVGQFSNVSNVPLEAQQYQAGMKAFRLHIQNEQSTPRTHDDLEKSKHQLQNVDSRDAPNKIVSVIVMCKNQRLSYLK